MMVMSDTNKNSEHEKKIQDAWDAVELSAKNLTLAKMVTVQITLERSTKDGYLNRLQEIINLFFKD